MLNRQLRKETQLETAISPTHSPLSHKQTQNKQGSDIFGFRKTDILSKVFQPQMPGGLEKLEQIHKKLLQPNRAFHDIESSGIHVIFDAESSLPSLTSSFAPLRTEKKLFEVV